MSKRKTELRERIARLWEIHNKECDKALAALEAGDNMAFEFYRGSASAILDVINDLADEMR